MGQNDPAYGGDIYSLSPDHGAAGANPNLISASKYKELIDAHVMFKDMAADPYLASAGIASDWPYGRGCWQSSDKQCVIWFGEEDQLRIMCMKKGTKLNEVFDRLKQMLDTVESIDGIEFARSDKYGYHVVPEQFRNGNARLCARKTAQSHGGRHGRKGQKGVRAARAQCARNGWRAYAHRRRRHGRHFTAGASLYPREGHHRGAVLGNREAHGRGEEGAQAQTVSEPSNEL